MFKLNESQAKAINRQSEIMTFQFSESKQSVRNLLIDQKPWFVGKDVCDILELQNSRQAVRELDDDEKLMYKLYTSGQNRKMWLVSESGLYALILRSNKPQAKTFRKWITSEVIPALLKKGYYNMGGQQKVSDYIDARDIPYTTQDVNDYPVRVIRIDKNLYYSLNDVHRAIHSSTRAGQAAKILNAKKEHAIKIWLFGNTHPAWFVTLDGVKLLVSGSKLLKASNKLKLKAGLSKNVELIIEKGGIS